jgi:hypothetical protein
VKGWPALAPAFSSSSTGARDAGVGLGALIGRRGSPLGGIPVIMMPMGLSSSGAYLIGCQPSGAWPITITDGPSPDLRLFSSSNCWRRSSRFVLDELSLFELLSFDVLKDVIQLFIGKCGNCCGFNVQLARD